MDKRELALKLLEMQHKLDVFWESLSALGIDISESILGEIDPLTIVGELYELTSDDDDDVFRTQWKDIRLENGAPEKMIDILNEQKSR